MSEVSKPTSRLDLSRLCCRCDSDYGSVKNDNWCDVCWDIRIKPPRRLIEQFEALQAELEAERKTAMYLDGVLAKHHETTGWNCPVCNPATSLPYPSRHGSSLYDKDADPATRPS